MKGIVNSTITYYPGRHYNLDINVAVEKGQKFYFVGMMTIAVRVVGEEDALQWIFSDLLNSTMVTENEDGTQNSSIQYTVFGEVRTSSGLAATKYLKPANSPRQYRLLQNDLLCYYLLHLEKCLPRGKKRQNFRSYIIILMGANMEINNEKDYPKWPLSVDHITSDGEDMDLIGWGIISNRELQGFQSEISYEIGHATTIIEFSLEGKPVRTDSPFIDLAMHPVCKLFRRETPHRDDAGNETIDIKTKRCIPGVLCYRSDQAIAELFYGLFENEITSEEIEKRKNSNNNLNQLFVGVHDYTFKLKEIHNRKFLEYDCPLLGYRELAFPILFAKKVIAVFFTGQLTVENKETYITNMISNVKNRFPNSFTEDSDRDFENKLIIAQDIWLKGKLEFEPHPIAEVLSAQKYNNIIINAILGIKNLEKRLEEAFTHRQHEYIRKSIPYAKELEQFIKPSHLSKNNRSIKNPQIQGVIDESEIIELWSGFEKSLDQIVTRFSLRYAFAFGPSRIFNIDKYKFGLQAVAGDFKNVFITKPQNDWEIDFTEVSEDDGYEVLTSSKSEDVQKINRYLGANIFDLGDFQLVLMQNLQHPSSSIAILLGYPITTDKPMSSFSEHAANSYIHQTLKSYFSIAALAIAAIRAKGLEELAKKQLLFLGHEAGQLTGGLDWLRICYRDAKGFEERLRKHYLNDNNAIITGLRKKIEDLCSDIRGYTGQMAFVFDTAERLGSNKIPEAIMGFFYPYGDVLAKWKDTYRQECDQKRLNMWVEIPEIVNGSRNNDPYHPPLWGDQFLFEQVVYNLVNNAEKYCYRGTTIEIYCGLKNLGEDAPYLLSVIDYGLPYISTGGNLLDPFIRGESSDEIPGLGIGLYSVRIIVEEVFKGMVIPSCDPQPISEFNIPLIKPYIDTEFEGKDEKLTKRLELELARLSRDGSYETVVAFEPKSTRNHHFSGKQQKYIPTIEVIKKEICKMTYKVSIDIEIPVNKDWRNTNEHSIA